mgnify:CR=1 FL=1
MMKPHAFARVRLFFCLGPFQPRERLISAAPDQASMHVAARRMLRMARPHRLAIERAHRQLELDLLALAEGILALQGPGDSGSGGDTTTDNEVHPLAAPGVHQFSLAAGEQHAGVDFGNFELGSIGGTGRV